ncbi:MAG: exodeoxyribonuclease VII large subunit, partial [Gemmatimonadetes bacterium]|nr:exodeoxyribonuclease VII large subunit [Gemmatimonadota bacterium]NIR78666.1 exodeoxyribonuclease VII large subunit [Gemmatimonadota bacterium]NIT87287.1 exodeoxyribonuclease VII large subunit [Gemmatimonadota bacterium]NIU31131.1 exodeoxyribonuclease VII large subunit [Gemmatimonadota bacterium]NIU35857.1 exodeoxyribonuclease VII large subunit [Gemmatimonadota bacterium]
MNLDLFGDGGDTGEGVARNDVTDPTPEPPARRPETPDPGGEPTVWSVSQVNRAVRTLLEETIPPIWVGGEVANWTRARSGHRYFTLKDEEAQLDCVMWRSDAEGLPTEPDEGMTVRAHGTLTIYEGRGRYQMVVRRLEGEGAEGLWRLAFEKLRKKLDAEGLLAPERKRPLPRFPERVG